MPLSPSYKPIHIKPVTGVMDLRSPPDLIPIGGYRFCQNMMVDEDGKLARMSGWRKAFWERSDNNWDLHDQLSPDPSDPASVQYTRQPITMLYEAVTPANFSHLFAATQNRIYYQNNESGNWRVISDQLGGAAQSGCQEKRWRAAHVNGTVVFSNGDEIVYHVIGQPAMEGSDQSVTAIPDLVELNITKAKLVVSWNSMILLMGIEQDGVLHPNRILWSDYKRPLSFLPSAESLAGYQDLDTKDVIIGAAEIKNYLLIYTTYSIWQLQVVGGEVVFSVTRRWASGPGGSRTLAYPNTLVSTGEEHYYFGIDGIYKYSLFDQEPVRVDWIHRGSKRIFSTIDKSRCQLHVGAYQGDRHLIWWSWAKTGESCPAESFVINVLNSFSAYVDHGFSAMLLHEPDSNKTIRTWMLEMCICDAAGLDTYGFNLVKEGGYCTAEQTYSCDQNPATFYSSVGLDVGGVEVEDWTGDPDPNSLFTILGTLTVSELCGDEYREDDCNADRMFIAASSVDGCLKAMSTVYYREVATDFTRGGCGAYSRAGYRSRLLSGPLDLNLPDDDKNINRFAIEQHAEAETSPAQIVLSVGAASQAVDPLLSGGRCVILWDEQDAKLLECLSDVSVEQHEEDGTRPNDEMEWPLYHEGRYLYFDLVILNGNTNPADMGGIVSFSRFTFDVVAKPRRG